MSITRAAGIAAFLALSGCKGDSKKSASKVEEDPEINKVRLTDLTQQPVDLSIYKGKTIFINFWATWCRPCIEELPSIENAQNILRSKDVIFLLASSESLEEIQDFKKNQPYKLKYVRVENSEALNIQALPTTFIFGPEGKLVYSEAGYRKWDEDININRILTIAKHGE